MCRYRIDKDPMKNLDEKSSKIILDGLKKRSKPTEIRYLKEAKVNVYIVSFKLNVRKKKIKKMC